MNDNQTNWTPFPDDNLLGLTDKNQINEIEAKGIANAELFIFELDTEILLSTNLILEIHSIAFGQLYDWAGKWRATEVTVGQLIPPKPTLVLQAMYQFIDNLNFKISIAENRILNETINQLVEKYETNDDKQVIASMKNEIIKLRIELGQGNVPSDFSDDYPFLPII